jgi:hypothetical protein
MTSLAVPDDRWSSDSRLVTSPSGPLSLSQWASRVSKLGLHRIQLNLQVQREVQSNGPINATIRGQFGERFRDLRCLTGENTCFDCPQTHICSFHQLFDTPEVKDEQGHLVQHGVHPFWFRGLPASRVLEAGFSSNVEMFLVSKYASQAPYVEIALRDALRRLRPQGWLQVSPAQISDEFFPEIANPEHDCWRFSWHTPLLLGPVPGPCFKECPQAPWLAAWLRSGVRRISSLLSDFAPDVPHWQHSFPDLTQVQCLSGELYPWRDARFSARQRKRIPLNGWVGEVVLKGDVLRELGGMFQALNIVQTGKSTSMGFGYGEAVPV